jgi:hypothetical protein
MPTDDDLRNISNKKDWSRQARADYDKLGWVSRLIIDFILGFPRVINWVRRRSEIEPDTRIGRTRRRANEQARKAKKRNDG